MQVVRLFLSFTVFSSDIGFISVTRSIADIKATNAVPLAPPQKKKQCVKKRILTVRHRSKYYRPNCVVIRARIMQVVQLFLSFTVFSNGVGFISVTRSIADIKGASAVIPPKNIARKCEF